METKGSLLRSQMFRLFRNMTRFYGEKLLAPLSNPKLEDHPLSTVRGYLFNIFTATLHVGDRSSIRNRKTRHAVVTGTHLSRIDRQGCLYTLSQRDYVPGRCMCGYGVKSTEYVTDMYLCVSIL